MSLRRLAIIAMALGLAAAPAAAQQSGQARTILVDEGGSYEVLVHPDFVTILYLPDKVDKAIASDVTSYEVKAIGATSLAIRPLKAGAKPASLAVATSSIKVSVVLRLVTNRDEAMTQVTFKRADVEAELERRITEQVKERTAALEARIAVMQQQMDAELPKLAEGLIAARMLKRREVRKLDAIERNDDNVVVETKDVLYLGDDAFVTFEIENRDKAPYRLAAVALRDGKLDHATAVRFASDAAETAGAGVIGVVRPGGRGQGVVVVRRAADVIGRKLTLEVSQPGGRGKVAVDRIVLR
ncbi:MAG: DUF2381 family protein [Kofleriaceae bacterium]|jgi:hypothetical protein|nr:DUF2381 family protein [Kofleriaceae bacterium]MBP9169817.1 DUF2381 family protein [Kofleriaceae bacterium]MBP9858092.1 DUF2381 family protein [Kofleriaceae bacterium]